MSDWWVEQLNHWDESGTFDRLNAAIESGQKVRIPRSDGSVSTGVIEATASFGGMAINVRIDEEPPMFKMVDTDMFLKHNPEFGAHLMHLNPKYRGENAGG